MQHRLLCPTATGRQTTVVNGRSYTGVIGTPLDVVDFDANVLEANGWMFVSLSGPTSGRPAGTITSAATPYPVSASLRYFDTDLNAIIVWDSANWRSPVTGAVV